MVIPLPMSAARLHTLSRGINFSLFIEPDNPEGPKKKYNEVEGGCKEILVIIVELPRIIQREEEQEADPEEIKEVDDEQPGGNEKRQ